jgi:hypothetical protein
VAALPPHFAVTGLSWGAALVFAHLYHTLVIPGVVVVR